MVVLTVRELSRQFDAEPVFQGVTFDVRAGEKVGVVGPNGAGKTTLLRILAGQDEADAGTVIIPGAVRVGFLEQRTEFPRGRTLIAEVRAGLAHLYELQTQAAQLATRMGETPDREQLHQLQHDYDVLHHELQRLDAYHIEHLVDEVLQGLGFAQEDYERDLSTFSGGQQNRALLARLLLEDPDLILLDEPTNHLDIATTEWLEAYLARIERAVVVVSHDRYFLDRVTNRTLEVFKGGVDDYPGNFSKYWKLRAERHQVLRKTWEKQQEFIAKTQEFIVKNKYGQTHAQAKDREKKLERLERVELPPEFSEIPMGFPEPARSGDWVLRTEDVSKGFPSPETGEVVPLFENLTLQVDRGERIGILGPNGSGKTTLLKVLIGELRPDTGDVRQGTNVEVGYFDQQLLCVDHSLDAVEAVRPTNNPQMTPGTIRGLLARFGVTGDLALQTISHMSGGETTKVALARLAASAPNVMVLDEPTNHLDFWACAALEKSLREFSGTVLFVSHDRYFLDQVATDIISLAPDRWWRYEGNYSAFQAFLKSRSDVNAQPDVDERPEDSSTPEVAESAGKPRRKRKFRYRVVADIEQDITQVEELITHLEIEMADPETHKNHERMSEIQQEYDAAQTELATLMEHWAEAAELN